MEKNLKHAMTTAMLILIKKEVITMEEFNEVAKHQDYDKLCNFLDKKLQELE